MEGGEDDPLTPIILNERADLPGLDTIHNGKTIIVKLKDTEDGTGQMFQTYTTSVKNLEKGHEETEIAFEIIQEPLLNESAVVENRLFFEPDYQLDRTIPHSKESMQILSFERGKDDGQTIAKPEQSEHSILTNYSVQELIDNNANNDSSKVELSTNMSSHSSVQNSADTDTLIKLEVEDPDEIVKKPEVVKKTTVEAFVKMIVCRKITVEKKDAKTGDVLDVDIKMEEEEPVVLGVDYVETTEDAISGNISKQNIDSFKEADTSLKAINSISEKSPKIGKSLLTNSFIQSALKKKISKVLQTDKNSYLSSPIKESPNLGQANGDKKSSDHSVSDSEWIEDLNDDSADYVPFPSSKCKPFERRQRSHRDIKLPKFKEEMNSTVSSANINVEKDDNNIHLPKKRGRKKKWDRTIGLTCNMKICQFCNKSFDTVSSCNKHMKRGSCVSLHFCFICSKTFDSERQLEVHISSHRNENKRSASYDCSDCKRSYRTKSGYIKHFRMGTCSKREIFEDGETGDFSCEYCDSRFSTLDYLHLHHYKVHENPKDRHICPNCGRTFYSLQGFQRHRSGRPCTEPLKCHICGKTYKAKESFKLHMKHHKSEITGITFNCDECGRSYMTEAALTKHKLLHTGVKPYKCEVCGKEFAMRYQVKDHARMHSGEKPYSCSICHVAFSNKGHLGRHLRSHENGTLLRRGRPKKTQEPESNISSVGNGVVPGETRIKLGQTLKTMDGQMIQVIDSGQIFNGQGDAPPPMIIKADNNNTIIIAEGWPESSVPVSQTISTINNNNEIIVIGS